MIKQAVFRFYEELNDFLPSNKKKLAFRHSFFGNPSVKDVIEAIGVPHVEVDLILINGISVDFGHTLKENDYVSVYPVFETLDISGVQHLRPIPLRLPRFILDEHLGKLARQLRMLGFDTIYHKDFDDKKIVRIANEEHRIILTRDVGLLKIKAVTRGYFIRSQQPAAQLRETLNHFDLYGNAAPFTRCIKCNGILKEVDKEKIIHRLEPLTKTHFHKFFQCNGCQGIFWEGSHFERMKSVLDTINKNQEKNQQ